MTINGRDLDVNRMMHEISLECAKIEIEDLRKSGDLRDEEDITKYLDRMFRSYVHNFAFLSEKTDEEVKRLASEEL